MNELSALESAGLTLPSPAYLIGLIVFGLLGFAAYRYGKKTTRPTVKWLGVALMLYPYAVSETWQLYAVGVALCGGVYWFREQG